MRVALPLIIAVVISGMACGGEHAPAANPVAHNTVVPSDERASTSSAAATSTGVAAAPPANVATVADAGRGGRAMWGDAIGDAFGDGGLGLAGVGEGGGGRGEGICLCGDSRDSTAGVGPGADAGTYVKAGRMTVDGNLPDAVIGRIVRQNFGRFRLCYENGLRANASLAGQILVAFVIDRSGAVESARDEASELSDRTVVDCIVRGFGNLSFPQPEGGTVRVVMPIRLTPPVRTNKTR